MTPRSPSLHPVAVALILLMGAGCAPVLSSMQPARTVDEGKLAWGTGLDGSVPVSGIFDTVDVLDQTDQVLAAGGELSEAQVRDVVDASLALLLNPPSLSSQFAFAYGLTDQVIGLPYHGGFGLGFLVSPCSLCPPWFPVPVPGAP